MFSPKGSDLIKLDVLEAKFNIYEDLSRQMLDKLESAVDKISEANSAIANILTKHDERIDQTLKNDKLFMKEIDEMKLENRNDHEKVMKRIDKVESKIDEFVKFRWIVVGAIAIISFIISISSHSTIIVDLLQPKASQEYKIK